MNQPTSILDKPLPPVEVERIVTEFHREGSVIVPNVFSRDECTNLRARLDALYAAAGPGDIFSKIVYREPVIKDAFIRDLLVREPLLGIAQAVLGVNCKYVGSTAIRNGLNDAIDFWHIDLGGEPEFPLPPDVPRHDPRITMPVLWFTFQIALSDIDCDDDGPTQFVPGSHYSGRMPSRNGTPEFEGRGPVSLLCKAGDMYLTNHQAWHRGSPNKSGKMRYLLQLQYGKRWAAIRFNGDPVIKIEAAMEANGGIKNHDPRLQELMDMTLV